MRPRRARHKPPRRPGSAPNSREKHWLESWVHSLALLRLREAEITPPSRKIRVAHDADTAEPSPYIEVRDRLEARIVRSVYYQLVELGQERRIDGEDVFGVWSSGQFFSLGRLG